MSKAKQDEFLKLYEPVHDQFERFCRARVYGGMEFRDLMNETLLIAFQKFETIRSEKAFLSFLIGISIRILANNRKKRSESSFHAEEQAQTYSDSNAHTDANADVYFLYQAMAQLPDEQREALILFELSGFNIKEIANIQSASESAVKKRLQRGRERLTELLQFDSTTKRKEVQHGK